MSHGTVNQYANHKCRCDLCSLAHRRYEKRRKYLTLIGQPYTLPAVGFKRRVRALMALGWTHRQISAELGIATGNLATKLRLNDTVVRATHEAMCDLYERLSMQMPPDTESARRTRAMAQRRGWAPPLSWDDIDTDPAPVTAPDHARKSYVDHAAVERRLAGDKTVRLTPAEAAEVCRRAYRAGRSTNWIEEMTGLKAERYFKVGEDAA